MAIATTYGLEKVTSPKIQYINNYSRSTNTQTRFYQELMTQCRRRFIVSIISLSSAGLLILKDITNQQIYDWVKWHKERGIRRGPSIIIFINLRRC